MYTQYCFMLIEILKQVQDDTLKNQYLYETCDDKNEQHANNSQANELV